MSCVLNVPNQNQIQNIIDFVEIEGKKLVGILHMEMKNKSCSFPILLTLIDVKKKSYVCALFSIQNLYCINMDAHTKVIKILKNNESEFPNWNGEAMHLYGYSM